MSRQARLHSMRDTQVVQRLILELTFGFAGVQCPPCGTFPTFAASAPMAASALRLPHREGCIIANALWCLALLIWRNTIVEQQIDVSPRCLI